MASITKRTAKDGSVTYRITVSHGYGGDGSRKRETITYKPQATTPGAARKEAEAFAVKFEESVMNGTACLSGDQIRFKDFVKIWEDKCLTQSVLSGKLTIRSKEDYIKIMEKHVIPQIGEMKLSKIKAVHIDDIVTDLLKDGKSPNTIRNIYNTIHACLDYAFRKDFVPFNPCLKCEPLPEVKHDKILRTFDAEQVQRFLNDALTREYDVNIGGRKHHTEKRSVSLQFRVFFTLLFYTGCRRGELVALDWTDVNMKERTIQIDQAVARYSKGLYLKDPKTPSGNRTIKLPEVCFELLQEWKTEQKKICMMLGTAWEGYRGRDYDKNPVFIQDTGKRMYVETPSHKFRSILSRYNEAVNEEDRLPVIRLHDIRHTNASHLIDAGVNIEEVSQNLGHSKPSFTMDVYGHALKKVSDKAADVLEEKFKIAQ